LELNKLLRFHGGKRLENDFWNFMKGQTISLLETQGGIYIDDLTRFINYRNQGLKGKEMPLDD